MTDYLNDFTCSNSDSLKFTSEDLIEIINKMQDLAEPKQKYAIYCSKQNEDMIKEAIKDEFPQYKVIPVTGTFDKDNVFIMSIVEDVDDYIKLIWKDPSYDNYIDNLFSNYV